MIQFGGSFVPSLSSCPFPLLPASLKRGLTVGHTLFDKVRQEHLVAVNQLSRLQRMDAWTYVTYKLNIERNNVGLIHACSTISHPF